ncbi:hypothetical protein LTR91_017042 [Friedmanniomyces endolithicus]|uniref:Uncharacterized protein n=1 Tax=Friedmanniomyces endolithicus TaxID=329885 RepID=A0AAN6K6X4_9PEZI|nr:hypothetical protein LTR94_012380 [Friedmanniomyces endolithicus]KAK0782208.1 hypothetical protein LTR75_014462 [Friedmanniomyces endolithicus]KAK0800982.1 hypothetical protein LTR59_005551 [Friedmanniomyces endolithicus]KAK0818771.1 hypothetical protein LTR38_000869 [Friedmanniomyces endolithicus]KAK0855213.1 hypothetical protein LTR03_001979 [Friedmanniomyces endolithicus]
MSAPTNSRTSSKTAVNSSKTSTSTRATTWGPRLTVPPPTARPTTPSRLNTISNASSTHLHTPKRRPTDKYTQVAAELPALFLSHSTYPDQPSIVRDALLELRSWFLERPANMVQLAKTLRSADLLTPINFTSQTQIGWNLAAADVDGHLRGFEREPEVMRAVGACVVEAWAELGHALVERDEICGEEVRCCCVQ